LFYGFVLRSIPVDLERRLMSHRRTSVSRFDPASTSTMGGRTVDLLPSGATDIYWAHGIELGSTLFRGYRERAD